MHLEELLFSGDIIADYRFVWISDSLFASQVCLMYQSNAGFQNDIQVYRNENKLSQVHAGTNEGENIKTND